MIEVVVVVGSASEATAALAGGADRCLVHLAGPPPATALADIARAIDGRCPLSLWCENDASDTSAESIEVLRADEVFVSAETTPTRQKAVPVRLTAIVPTSRGYPFSPCGRRWRAARDEGSRGFWIGASEPLIRLARAARSTFSRKGRKGTLGKVGEDFAFSANQDRSDGTLVGEPWQDARLLADAPIGDLAQRVHQARSGGRRIGFAGVTEMPDVPRLAALRPDFLLLDALVRAGGERTGPVDPARIRMVRSLVEEAGADGSPLPQPESLDRIFVRDWIVSMHLGAYAHESAPQRVRFSIEAAVTRAAKRAADLRDIVTYDLITDAIARATLAHVDLVETIAEDVAAIVLAHRRVVRVDVTVEKLDLGPGSLGCRIVRRRADPARGDL